MASSATTTTSTGNDETSLYTDLKSFLTSARLDLRRAATQAVLQATTDDDGRSKIVAHGLVAALTSSVSSSDALVSTNALQALLQLSSAEGSPLAKATAMQCVDELLQVGGLDRLMEILLTTASTAQDTTDDDEQWRNRVNLAMSLLANLTRSEEGSVALCGRQLPDEAVVANHASKDGDKETKPIQIPPKPTLELLLARYLNPHYVQDDIDYDALLHQQGDDETSASILLNSHKGDPFQHFAAVLMNATQVEQGRRFLLQLHYAPDSRTADAPPPTSRFQRLLPQLAHPNPIRRRGVAGMIRNCCSDKDSAFWFLTQVNLVDQHLLFPLAGPEDLDESDKQHLNPDLWLQGPSKRREPDHYTRLFLVQALYMLAKSGRQSRREMNRVKTSVILKWAGMVEEYEDVSEVIEQCMEYLKRDEVVNGEEEQDELITEANRIEILEDGEEDDAAADAMKTTAAPSVRGAATLVTQEDFDNVD